MQQTYYYLVNLPQRLAGLDEKTKEECGIWVEKARDSFWQPFMPIDYDPMVPVTYIECTYQLMAGFHHKDRNFNVELNIIPKEGYQDRPPFSLMTDDEAEDLLEFLCNGPWKPHGNLFETTRHCTNYKNHVVEYSSDEQLDNE